MCHLPSAETDEIYIPVTQPLLKKVVLEMEDDMPVRKIKRKKKVVKRKKVKILRKTENEDDEEPEPTPKELPSDTKLIKNDLPQIAPVGATVRTFEYTVQAGDTLNTIIQQHFSESVQPGQKIIVVTQPAEEKPEVRPAPAPVPRTIEYTVQKGDTLSSILRKYFNGNIYGKRSRLERLLELNKNIEEADTIHLGQVIIIPNPDEAAKRVSATFAATPEAVAGEEADQHEKKLAIYFNYRFNYISVTDSATGNNFNFNTDYDLEGGFDYLFRMSQKNLLVAGIGFSEYSLPRSVLAPSTIVEATRKTQASAKFGLNYELTDENIFGLILKYRPYFFLTNQKPEYVPAPALSLTYENKFYHENQTLLGFGLEAEAIAKQDYPQFKSEFGSAFSVSSIYQQEFVAKDWVTIEFLFQQRSQGSTYYKMNDKNAGFRFTYTLNL